MNGYFIFAFVVVSFASLSGCAAWNAERNNPPIGAFLEINGERMHVVDAR